ncbi:MAG TPA: S9 family peptidase, partial [Thermomicrobiales bacterium]|nr:S9 family peptidase [Thermomicrobiales bacterium]
TWFRADAAVRPATVNPDGSGFRLLDNPAPMDIGCSAWSPDGTRLLFVSDRAERGTSKLYLLRLDGGEARPLGDLQGDFDDPRWSPDGKTIAVLRKDPETPEEKKRKEDKDDTVVVDADPKLNRLWAIDVATGRARQLTYGTRQVWSYGWSPDGERLAITTTDEPGFDAHAGKGDLWTVPLAGGLPTHVATFTMNPFWPVFVETSDGPGIVVLSAGHRADPSDSVWFVSLAGGEPRNLLPGYEGNVEYLSEFPGSRSSVLVRIVERTHAHAYEFDVVTSELRPLTPASMQKNGSITAGPSLSSDGSTIAVVWSGGSVPHEVYVGKPGGESHAVTEFGTSFCGRLSPTEHVTWTSDGHEIEGILTYPAGYEEGKRYPLVVDVHGGPSWQWEDYAFLDWHDWAQQLASNGYAVLAPNPRGSTGRGSTFQALLQDDVGGGESRDLVAGALAMVERGIADRDRLGIGGWSWGGYLTAFTITQTDIFKAAVMGAGLSNMLSDHGQGDIPTSNLLYYPGLPYQHLDAYWQSSAIRYITSCTTPTLILHGDDDARVHPAQGAEMYRALKTIGVPVEFVRYPRQGHPIKERHHQIDLMRRLVAWFDRWLKA